MLYNLFLLLSQYEFSYNLSDEKYLNLELDEPFTVKMAGEIQEGDQVISFSQDTGKVETDLVTVIGQRDTDELYVIEVDGQSVTVTGEHPFYTKNRGWVEAQYLTEDDELLCESRGLIL